MKDYYYILGVDANCTIDEIKDAYRKLSKKFHPDVNQNDTYFESRFKEIQEACETLSDPVRRRRYDDQFIKKTSSTPSPEPSKQRRYPRTTAVDIIFTIVLIGITVLFGKYVVSSMDGSPKTVSPNKPETIADTPQTAFMPIKHHKKKKHNLMAADNGGRKIVPANKLTISTPAHPVNPTTSVFKTVPKALIKLKTDTFKPQPIAVANPPVQAPVSNVNNTGDNDLPYSSYLRSNITGVVNMHRTDKLNSDIVAVIPTHSKVTVLQKGDTYYKIRFNGDEGYVPKWTVLTK